jgi:putative addiction module component (TIGR02574 family)
MTVEAITSAALALPDASRAELVETLIRSLEESVAANHWPEWRAEIESRIDAYDRGEMKSYSREEVMQYLEEDTSK